MNFSENGTIILGNAISLFAAALMVSTGFIKRKDKVLSVQCIQFALFTLSNLVLGGITGSITNLISIIRNLVCIKWKFTPPVKIAFILIQVILAIIVNNAGIIGWLPIIAAVLFTWYMDINDEIKFKIVIIICQSMWVIYDLNIKNYVSMIFDVFTIISTLVGINMIIKETK